MPTGPPDGTGGWWNRRYCRPTPPRSAAPRSGSGACAATRARTAGHGRPGNWLDLDPTNRRVAPAHVTVAWGRDYTDVAPLKGIVFTEARHHLSVSVTVRRVDELAASEGPRPAI